MPALPRSSSGPVLGFGVDTFAFRNDSRIHHRGQPGIYCNRCFLMARAVGQFQRFARFAPGEPRLRSGEYAERVHQVTRRGAWRPALPDTERIVFPGFASLHALSRAEEGAVKDGLRGRFWTLVHWTNWRMTFPSPPGHQERVARETLAELRAGRPVQLFVTDFPRIKFNHSVLAFDYRASGEAMDFIVYDPNDPQIPGIVRFDPRDERFHPAPLCGVAVPYFRAFRQYYSPFF
ncbi:MAG: hypothetical protein ACREKJ_01920 [Candidatus Rokuibacteriota bacterium]